MGIISLNEKRNASNSTHTTGREKSFFTGDQFAEILVDPKITGHYHYYGSGTGGFGAFWEDTSGNVSDLTFSSTQGSIWSANERSASVQTSSASSWYDFEIDLTGKPNGRPVFYVRSGTGTYTYQNDWALDDISILFANNDTVSFDPSLADTRSNGLWMKSDTQSSVTNYTGAKSSYSSATLATIPNESGNAGLVWNYRIGGTVSSNTGPDNAADNNDNTYYLFWESTPPTNDICSYLTLKDYYNIVTGATI
tara:strand:+ start:474 stop:1229 length:756 start_codon:yes stop_codon:yes gene_type:complete